MSAQADVEQSLSVCHKPGELLAKILKLVVQYEELIIYSIGLWVFP